MTVEVQLLDKEKLKPCPFCGAENPVIRVTEIRDLDAAFYRKAYIECPKCNCETKRFDQMIIFDNRNYSVKIDDLSELVKHWNTRGGVSDGPD